ncbi:hypothetical protein FQN57_006538 [Myotisia sp. PD_48]|nr:hypothetical protein FQN57_006538 [Myotisia sp. PD_48]
MASIRSFLGVALLALYTTGSSANTTTQPTCNADTGKSYTDGKSNTYTIGCNNVIGTPTDEITRLKQASFKSCIDYCGWAVGCQSVDYDKDGWCILYKTGTVKSSMNKMIPNLQKGMPEFSILTQVFVRSERKVPREIIMRTVNKNKPPSTPPSTAPSPAPSTVPETGGQAPSGPPPPAPSTLDIVQTPKCPDDHDKGWVADDGTHYKIACKHHSVGTTIATLTGITSFTDCLKKCSETNGCISAQYMYSPPAQGYIANECVLSSGEGPGTPGCEHWFAYTVAPPPQPQADPFPYTLCETVCPFSDGLIYESDHGENFRMSCSKRHGMRVLWTQQAETFDDCMDLCAKIVPCHSVDYQARNKKCFMGDKHGDAQIAATGFASATSIGCAGACKKSSCCGKSREE